uniref:Uncharacterized protein n=1 Tax=Rhizophora mucronata TaxID=61149 RepID=A0A2P2P3K4_RHIMU
MLLPLFLYVTEHHGLKKFQFY